MSKEQKIKNPPNNDNRIVVSTRINKELYKQFKITAEENNFKMIDAFEYAIKLFIQHNKSKQ